MIEALWSWVGQISARLIRAVMGDFHRPPSIVLGLVVDLTRSRAELLAENAILRQQLIVAARAVKRPQFRRRERSLLALLASFVRDWEFALLLVKPATILRWHREGLRLLLRRKARSPKPSPPRVAREVAALIRKMAAENRLWGAERIRGELLKLGIHLSKRTIQKHMRGARPPRMSDGQTWRTFLRNHRVWACDFVPVRDLWFRSLFAFFIIDVNTKRIVHFATTRAPNEEWTTQQLRNATPFGDGPQILIRDRDNKFGLAFDRAAKSVGVRVVPTAPRAPRMNAACERFIGGLRRECLDHLIVLGERHLHRVLREYAVFFNAARPHQRIQQRSPIPTARRLHRAGASIISRPVLGGLHHDYQVAA